jgi:hypothetical protein
VFVWPLLLLLPQVRADLEMAGKLLAKRAQQQLKHNDSGKSEASIFMPPPPSAEDMGGAQGRLGWQAKWGAI